MRSKKVETWHGVIISTTYHVLKIWEGYDKKWMHFVYKLNHIFRSVRVSDGNSSVAKTIQFFCNQYKFKNFICSIWIIESHIPKLQLVLTSFANFHALTDFFELNDPEIGNHYRWDLKRMKLGTYYVLKSWTTSSDLYFYISPICSNLNYNWCRLVLKIEKNNFDVGDKQSSNTQSFQFIR